MINPQKVRIMSRKTLFEHNEGRPVLELKEYCEDVHVWKGLARSSLAGIMLYILLVSVAIIALPAQAQFVYEQLGDIWTILALAGTMAAFAAIYSLVSDAIFRKKYKSSRSTLSRYRSDAVQLDKLEHEQDKI